MHNKGFTLIELIMVIILISILAVSVAPKMDGTANYEAHSHRAQLISALRLTQQRAMQQTDTSDGLCHQVVFDDVKSRYGIPDRTTCVATSPVFPNGWVADGTGHTVNDNYEITYNINGTNNPKAVGFDWMGRPTMDCQGGCEINVTSSVETLKIFIEEEGYIHVFKFP